MEGGKPVTIGPFRFIEPYEFVFVTGTKKRWIGRSLVEVFTSEFKHLTEEKVIEKIASGKILVNGRKVPMHYVLKAADKIKHISTRIEGPVYDLPIKEIGETDDYVAYLKPGSVPLASTGGFMYNSMIKRVKSGLYPIHRLDRVTSGIIVLAKSEEAAKRFAGYLKDGLVHKTYYARVLGQFPAEEIVVDQPIIDDTPNRLIKEVGERGRPSKTVFKRIDTNGRESIVRCHPITGRTHQIRTHLKYLGYPISNDEDYGGNKPILTKEEKRALEEARTRGLWPPDTAVNQENPHIVFQIYLHSIRYECPSFTFEAPPPDWAELDPNECQMCACA